MQDQPTTNIEAQISAWERALAALYGDIDPNDPTVITIIRRVIWLRRLQRGADSSVRVLFSLE